MPIYEFYCPACHVVFSFFSPGVNTSKRPSCPRCERPRLERQLSRFATVRHGGGGEEADGPGSAEDGRMEQAMEMLAREADGIDENDPRQAAQMMRKLSDMTGLGMSDGMEEALGRIERGEDPEAVEAEMGELLDGEDPFTPGGERRAARGRASAPAKDEKLYRL